MEPLAVDLRLFTESGGAALRLNPGRGLMARVMAADGSGRGVINIAGAVLEAELPRHVRAGEQIRLVVRHLDAQRVVLELAHGQSAPVAADVPPAPVAVPLPGGGQLRVAPDGGQEGSPERSRPGTQTVALRYDAPHLGPLDLRLELGPAGLQVTVTASLGPPLQLAQAGAAQLREALQAAGEGQVSVTVLPRRQPLDIYA